jgi:23S rRNA pseudouridine2605 synthase
MTTDGETAHKLTHPSREVERSYVVTVRGDGPSAVRAARTGVELEDGWMQPTAISAQNVGRGVWDLEITITEGRNREIRRFCDALGLSVERLVRTRFGPVMLGSLRPGESRPLTGKERDIILAITQ